MIDPRTKKPEPQVNEAREELLAAFKAVALTESGQTVFRHLAKECGFRESNLRMNSQTGEFSGINTATAAGIQATWFNIRRLIPKKQLNLIEMER